MSGAFVAEKGKNTYTTCNSGDMNRLRLEAASAAEKKLFDNPKDNALLNAKQMARLLSINENQLYKLVRGGKIPVIKLGRALRFQWDVVIDQLRSQSCHT